MGFWDIGLRSETDTGAGRSFWQIDLFTLQAHYTQRRRVDMAINLH